MDLVLLLLLAAGAGVIVRVPSLCVAEQIVDHLVVDFDKAGFHNVVPALAFQPTDLGQKM